MQHTRSLKDVRVATPCDADWNKMSGDERSRFCSICQLNVYNLSAMTEPEALQLISDAEGKLCIRFYRRADGTILTQDCPVGIRKRAKACASRVAASVAGLVAMLVMPTSCAQKSDSDSEKVVAPAAEEVPEEEVEAKMGTVDPDMYDAIEHRP